MHGTLDNPPIVIYQDRAKIYFLMIFGVALTSFFVWSLVSIHGQHGFVRYLEYVLVPTLGAATLFIAWLIVRPGTLAIDKDHLTWKTGVRTFQYVWGDFTDFFVFSPQWLIKQPACHFSAKGRRRYASHSLGMGFGSFGGLWECSSHEIVDLLNKARTQRGAELI
jgi:hypothetical protein